jgi:pimeloyl-ACP methyl ester carboxylesterase
VSLASTPAFYRDTDGTIWRAFGKRQCSVSCSWLPQPRPECGCCYRHGNPRGLPPQYFDHVYQTFDRGTKRAVLKLYRNTRNTEDGAQQFTIALRPLDLPALIIWGAHDPHISVAFAERQREVFPHAEIRILPDSGHWPFADNPNSVAQVGLPFLRRQLQRPT